MKSLERAIAVLEILTGHPGGTTLSTIAKGAGIPPSTAHRILAVLCKHRLAYKDEAARRYRSGYGLLRLASAVDLDGDIRGVARSHLAWLRDRWNECVFLTAFIDEQAVCLEVLEAEETRGLRFFVRPGRVLPAHSAASAKVLLAFQDESVIGRALQEHRLVPFTSQTLTELEDVRAELGRIRQEGAAFCLGEQEVGVDAVAVPVRNARGSTVASIALVCPSERLQAHLKRGLLADLLKAAAAASAELGYRQQAMVESRAMQAAGR